MDTANARSLQLYKTKSPFHFRRNHDRDKRTYELILQILEYLSLEQLILKARLINKTRNILATARAKQLISSQWLSKVRNAIPLPPFYVPTLNTQFNLGPAGDFFGLSKEAAIYLRFESFSLLQEHLYWRGYYKSVLGAGRVVLPWRIVEMFLGWRDEGVRNGGGVGVYRYGV